MHPSCVLNYQDLHPWYLMSANVGFLAASSRVVSLEPQGLATNYSTRGVYLILIYQEIAECRYLSRHNGQ